LLRTIALDPGRHQIIMTYQPVSFKIGLWTAVAALLAMAAALVVRAKQKPDPIKESAP
jgi:hypothetical protein